MGPTKLFLSLPYMVKKRNEKKKVKYSLCTNLYLFSWLVLVRISVSQ